MSRSTPLLLLSAVVLTAGVAFGLGRGASAADPAPAHRIVYLFVSGKGPQAKAWFDGGPPQGLQVQAALDTFARDGFHYVAVSSSGVASRVNVSTGGATATDAAAEAEYLVLLER
jgi:hypothetical protein